ncbi:MAG: ABC transporter permease [Clostridia bacterium]|nr:ABC transporter permease [Clostridia bacterium]
MLKFALKNMLTKKVKMILIILSIVISASVAILAYNVAEQVNDGLINTTSTYDTIIGPAGSSTQLAMNTLFFTDKPLGTISYEYYEQLEADSRVNVAIPFAMGDSYNSAKIVGTKPSFLDGKALKEGEMFDEVFEAVVGSGVAKKFGLKIGDELVTSHGLSENGEKHTANPLKLVGILDETNTAYDNTVFTDIETVWKVHEHHHDEDEEGEDHDHDEDHEDEHDEDGEHGEEELDADGSDAPAGHTIEEEHDDHDDDHDEDEHEGHAEEGTVCAILLKCKTLAYAEEIKKEFAADSSILTITPAEVIREIISNVDLSRKIVYLLCIIILIMNIFVISTITILNMYDSQKDIALMRLIGIGTGKVNALFLIQNAIIGLISTAISFGISRLVLSVMSDFVSSMGIVLDAGKVYSFEWLIMAVVFVISVLPTLICTVHISRKDIIRN